MDIPEVTQLIEKYGSKKALIVIAGMFAVFQLAIPEMLEPKMVAWILIAKVAGITILGAMGLIFQWKLDSQDEPRE